MSKKLTPRQNMIVYCMQNGWDLIVQNGINHVICCTPELEFTFSVTLLLRLESMDIIYQEWGSFDYVLTEYGKSLVTKKVNIEPTNEQSK